MRYGLNESKLFFDAHATTGGCPYEYVHYFDGGKDAAGSK